MSRITTSGVHHLFEIFRSAKEASPVPIGPNWSFADFQSEYSESECLTYEIPDSDQPYSFILYRDNGEALEISMLATHPQMARRGFMRELLKRLIQTATRLGKPIWLEVHEANRPARELYEAFGFSALGRRPRYYSDGGAAILYTRLSAAPSAPPP